MSEQPYTAGIEEVRESFVTGQIRDGNGNDWTELESGAGIEFDRWLAAHDRAVARAALDGLAEYAALRMGAALTDRGADDWRRTRAAAQNYRDAHHGEEPTP